MSDFYWPLSGEVGTYTLCRPQLKDEGGWELCGDGLWRHTANDGVAYTSEYLKRHGYLGVRREPEKPVIARVTLRDGGEHKPPRNALAPDPDDGNAMVAQEALDELRMCRKSYQFERWSIKWGRPLTEMLGAR